MYLDGHIGCILIDRWKIQKYNKEIEKSMVAPNGGSLHPPAPADWAAPCWGAPAPQERDGKGKKEESRGEFQRLCKTRHRAGEGKKKRESERKAEEKAGKQGMK